jgi:hypothetical protein
MNSKKITLQSTVTRAKELLATELDDETVLMSIENGSYYGMEKTGRRLWELIESPMLVSKLIVFLSEEYNVAPDICGSDIIDYLQELYDEKLIVVS